MNITEKLIHKSAFFQWLDSLRNSYKLIGPVKVGEQAAFREISSSNELFMEYETTMLSPGKLFLYKPKENLFRFTITENITLPSIPSHQGRGKSPIKFPSPPVGEGEGEGGFSSKKITVDEIQPDTEKQVIVGIHPCDTNAILYLDRTFLGEFRDTYYETRRKNTLIISLNCTNISKNCFCSSVGSGPFLKAVGGCDMLLTDFGDEYLVEIKSRRSKEFLRLRGKEAGTHELRIKSEKERLALSNFKKSISVEGLDDLFMENMDHPVWQHTAEDKCLSCSNCVMVCPTCFCYGVGDETSIDLTTVTRYRHLDACQDTRFAEVHGGNFRQRRASRLRQFVTHNLNQTGQYGLMKTVGCGRCITWCPTGIDLTEITKEIQKR